MTIASPLPAPYRRILLTGGTGFVGGHLCPRLVAAFPQAERLILTRSGDPVTRAGFATKVVDLTDRVAVATAVQVFQPDLVMHLAAQASAASAAKLDTWRINLEATLHLAGAVTEHAPTATVFFVSSAEIYGLSFRDGPASEATWPRPMNAYARAKYAAELALADVLPASATLIVARAFNHTGPGQDTRFALPAFAAQIAAIEAGHSAPRLMVGNLDAERDFLDVRDVCDAYLALLATTKPGDRTTVNIASGKAYRIGDLLDEVRALARTSFEIVQDPARMRPSEIARSVGRGEALTQRTGWAPRFAISDTLRDVLDDQRQRIARAQAS